MYKRIKYSVQREKKQRGCSCTSSSEIFSPGLFSESLAQTGIALAPVADPGGPVRSFWLTQPITLISYPNTMSSKKDMRRADLGEWKRNCFEPWLIKTNVEK